MTLLESAAEAQRVPTNHSARDAYIAGRLVTAYALSEQLAVFGLRVDVHDAVVTVSGTVDDRVQRDLAEAIARDIDEVRDVRCEISVEAPAPRLDGASGRFARRFNDASLTARVRTRLLWNGETHGQDIQVAARDGLVTFDLAAQLVADVPGVCGVENQLAARRQ